MMTPTPEEVTAGCLEVTARLEMSNQQLETSNRQLETSNRQLERSNRQLEMSNEELRTRWLTLEQQRQQITRGAEADASIWGPLYLNLVCSQLLLFCLKAQPRAGGLCRRFTQRLSFDRRRLQIAATYLGVRVATFCSEADAIIDKCNSAVHFPDVASLEAATRAALALTQRYPIVGLTCPKELQLLRAYGMLKNLFQF